MGSRTERMLMEELEERGWVCMRAPASGARPTHDPGDVWAGRMRADDIVPTTELFIIEEKYKSNDSNRYLQENGDKFDKMIQLADDLGATPVLAVRWSTQTDWSPGAFHLFRDAREVRRTDAGNVSVSPSDAEENYKRLDTFFG